VTHDEIIQTLEERLRDSGNFNLIRTCVEYKVSGTSGEIDLYGLRRINGYKFGYAFEIKTFDRTRARESARKQLRRDCAWLRQKYDIDHFLGFYAYRRGELQVEIMQNKSLYSWSNRNGRAR
jgi:hypothetical protein